MASSTGRIFVSYRQQDTAWPASALYQRLVERFGEQHVFKDIDNIRLGEDFVQKITDEVEKCDILLALIGNGWLLPDENGRRRIDEPNDFVRLEIKTALDRNVMLIPILVDGASMPSADNLPSDINALVRRQALGLNPHLFRGSTERTARCHRTEIERPPRTRRETRTPSDDPHKSREPRSIGDNPWTPGVGGRYLLMLGKRNPTYLRMILEANRDERRSIDRSSVAEFLGRDEGCADEGAYSPVRHSPQSHGETRWHGPET